MFLENTLGNIVQINICDKLCDLTDDDKCESCPDILEELETIDDDTDKHGIQFVKSNDAKLAAEIGVFSFPALVYYETGVPIMYDGKYTEGSIFAFLFLSLPHPSVTYNPRFSRGNKIKDRALRALTRDFISLSRSPTYVRKINCLNKEISIM